MARAQWLARDHERLPETVAGLHRVAFACLVKRLVLAAAMESEDQAVASMRRRTSLMVGRRSVTVLALLSLRLGGLSGAVVGNVPLEQLKADAARIVAGVVRDVASGPVGSEWTIQVVRAYKGAASPLLTARSDRPLTDREAEAVRGRRAIFLLDGTGRLLPRTGSVLAADLFVPAPDALSSAADVDAAFCVDWMRGLASPGAAILRDLAVAAAGCARPTGTRDEVRRELSGSPRTADALVAILVGLAHGDPAAVLSLEAWVGANPDASPALLENAAWGLFGYSSPDAGGALALRRLALGARSERIREAAATVLAYVHSEETWPDLAALLDSPDRQVRWLALQGLQQAVDAGARGEPGPFDRPLVHLGQPVARAVRKRPPIPESARVTMERRDGDDRALVRFWREFAARNR